VAFALSRSGSAGGSGGTCGTRLQFFKAAVAEANAASAPLVENAAPVLVNVADPIRT
jgi:hypothetical protein